MPIHTERLVLIPGSRSRLEAELESREALARALGVVVPETWPPPLYDANAVRWVLECLDGDARFEAWGARYFVLDGTVVGAGGFKGPPSDDGVVEIGYSILPEFQGRGLASEAARGMVHRAFESPEVRGVIAETLPQLAPSIRVLENAGFARVGNGSEPGVIRFERRRPGPP